MMDCEESEMQDLSMVVAKEEPDNRDTPPSSMSVDGE